MKNERFKMLYKKKGKEATFFQSKFFKFYILFLRIVEFKNITEHLKILAISIVWLTFLHLPKQSAAKKNSRFSKLPN